MRLNAPHANIVAAVRWHYIRRDYDRLVVFLVLDLGSSATRALLYDDDLQPLPQAIARAPFAFETDARGRSTDDAHAALARVVVVLDQLHALAELRGWLRAGEPLTLAVAAYASSLVCLDAAGAPLSPVFTYADTQCADDARALRQTHDELETLQRTGCRIRASYAPARIAWLRRTQPETVARAHTFAALSDWLTLQLTGALRTGISIASWSGLLNRAQADWDQTWCDALQLRPGCLPPIWQPDEPSLPLLPMWQQRWPRFSGARLRPPIGDGAAANLGSSCRDASRIAVTIGSTAAARMVKPLASPADTDPLPPALWSYRVDHTHALVGGALTEGGNVFAWARRLFALPDDEALEQALAQCAPDAHGLTVLPTLGGERSPGYADDIRATLHGLSFDTRPVDVVRALMEAVALRLATVCEALRSISPADLLVGSGGALLASPTWQRIVADAVGLPLRMCAQPETTSLGAALAARGDWHLSLALEPPITPDPHAHAHYCQARHRQAALYAALRRWESSA